MCKHIIALKKVANNDQHCVWNKIGRKNKTLPQNTKYMLQTNAIQFHNDASNTQDYVPKINVYVQKSCATSVKSYLGTMWTKLLRKFSQVQLSLMEWM